MLGGRGKLPVLAEIGLRPAESRAWALRRADLEACHSLLDNLAGKGSVLVTGGEKGVGAVAVGIAMAATASGRRVALLECEMERPRLAAALGLAPVPGLHEYLRHQVEAPRVLQPLVPAGPASRPAVGPLVCVVSGAPAADRDELLASDGFRHATAKLRRAYDLVVLAGPWLDAGASALAPASAQAETALVCVPPAWLSGRAGRSARTVLRSLSAPIAGAVVVGEKN